MSTKIYGCSDDNIDFDGDVSGEVGCYGTDESEHGVLLVCSDGTLLDVKYCMTVGGVWGIKLIQSGTLFERIDVCNDSEAKVYSDVAYFAAGLKWIFAAKDWEKVH